MQGRRIYPDENIKMHDLEPGDYAKAKDGTWWLRCPNGTWGRIRANIHKITEHDDGTITASPSILCYSDKDIVGWHGFLEKGIWREC